jgi:hypothetical protein
MAKTLVVPVSVLVLLAGLLSGQANLRGPVAGYLAGPGQPELRAITGVPGAYLFSDPLPLPAGSTRVQLAPGQNFGLIERGMDGLAVLYLSGGAIDRAEAIGGAMPAADWAAFSSGGGAAVLYCASAGRLQLLAGLPGTPRIVMDVDASALPEQPLNAAVSDDGNLFVLASGNAVYLVPNVGAARLLLSAGGILSLAVLPNGTDVVVADRTTASIHVLENAASSATGRVLASGLSGMGKIFPAADGGSIFVSRPGVKAVSLIDLRSGGIQTFPTETAPVQLAPLLNRDTFLISNKSRQPGAIFLRDEAGGRVVWVPAARIEAGQ